MALESETIVASVVSREGAIPTEPSATPPVRLRVTDGITRFDILSVGLLVVVPAAVTAAVVVGEQMGIFPPGSAPWGFVGGVVTGGGGSGVAAIIRYGLA